jgi:signal transduction histidine kinase
VIIAVAAISALTVETTYASYASDVRGWRLAVEVVVGVLACGLVPLLLGRPAATTPDDNDTDGCGSATCGSGPVGNRAVVVALVLAVLAAVTPAATPASSLGVLHVARCRRLPVAVGVALVGVVAHTVRGLWLPIPGLSFSWWLALVVVGHVALVSWGALAAARSALIASLQDRARRAEAEQGRRVAEARAAERARIAREMHDVLAHRLSLLATYAGALEYRPDHPPERLAKAAGVIRTGVHQALEELRDVIVLLREDTTGDASGDGPQRPVPALGDLPDLIEESRAIGTPVDVRGDIADPAALPGPTGRTAYRLVQEALTNARKHAPGQPVSIALGGVPGGRLVIDVCNPVVARGPDDVPAIPGTGTGLVGLTERVRLVGGQLDHQATPGEFRLHAWLPWPA